MVLAGRPGWLVVGRPRLPLSAPESKPELDRVWVTVRYASATAAPISTLAEQKRLDRHQTKRRAELAALKPGDHLPTYIAMRRRGRRMMVAGGLRLPLDGDVALLGKMSAFPQCLDGRGGLDAKESMRTLADHMAEGAADPFAVKLADDLRVEAEAWEEALDHWGRQTIAVDKVPSEHGGDAAPEADARLVPTVGWVHGPYAVCRNQFYQLRINTGLTTRFNGVALAGTQAPTRWMAQTAIELPLTVHPHGSSVAQELLDQDAKVAALRATLADKVAWAEKLGQKLPPQDVEMKIYTIPEEAEDAAAIKEEHRRQLALLPLPMPFANGFLLQECGPTGEKKLWCLPCRAAFSPPSRDSIKCPSCGALAGGRQVVKQPVIFDRRDSDSDASDDENDTDEDPLEGESEVAALRAELHARGEAEKRVEPRSEAWGQPVKPSRSCAVM
jgi:hypothetical protein